MLLGRREVDDGCAAEWERAGLLVGRELDCWVGEMWTDDLVREGCAAG